MVVCCLLSLTLQIECTGTKNRVDLSGYYSVHTTCHVLAPVECTRICNPVLAQGYEEKRRFWAYFGRHGYTPKGYPSRVAVRRYFEFLASIIIFYAV
jgi:hypothetical protein